MYRPCDPEIEGKEINQESTFYNNNPSEKNHKAFARGDSEQCLDLAK